MKKSFTKLLAAAVLLSAGLFASAQEKASLIVTKTDGHALNYGLVATPSITFNDSIMTVTVTINNAQKAINFKANEVKSFTYGMTTYVNTPTSDKKISFRIAGQTLAIQGVKSAKNIRLYQIDGKQLPVDATENGESTQVNLSGIAAGVYVISADGETFKFMKR